MWGHLRPSRARSARRRGRAAPAKRPAASRERRGAKRRSPHFCGATSAPAGRGAPVDAAGPRQQRNQRQAAKSEAQSAAASHFCGATSAPAGRGAPVGAAKPHGQRNQRQAARGEAQSAAAPYFCGATSAPAGRGAPAGAAKPRRQLLSPPSLFAKRPLAFPNIPSSEPEGLSPSGGLSTRHPRKRHPCAPKGRAESGQGAWPLVSLGGEGRGRFRRRR